jgi:hypothetical protein
LQRQKAQLEEEQKVFVKFVWYSFCLIAILEAGFVDLAAAAISAAATTTTATTAAAAVAAATFSQTSCCQTNRCSSFAIIFVTLFFQRALFSFCC